MNMVAGIPVQHQLSRAELPAVHPLRPLVPRQQGTYRARTCFYLSLSSMDDAPPPLWFI